MPLLLPIAHAHYSLTVSCRRIEHRCDFAVVSLTSGQDLSLFVSLSPLYALPLSLFPGKKGKKMRLIAQSVRHAVTQAGARGSCFRSLLTRKLSATAQAHTHAALRLNFDHFLSVSSCISLFLSQPSSHLPFSLLASSHFVLFEGTGGGKEGEREMRVGE